MGDRAMAQWLRVLTVLPEEQCQDPRLVSHIVGNYISGGPHALFWIPTLPMDGLNMDRPIHRFTQLHTTLKIKINLSGGKQWTASTSIASSTSLRTQPSCGRTPPTNENQTLQL